MRLVRVIRRLSNRDVLKRRPRGYEDGAGFEEGGGYGDKLAARHVKHEVYFMPGGYNQAVFRDGSYNEGFAMPF